MNKFNPVCLVFIAMTTAIGACFGSLHAAIVGFTVGLTMVVLATIFG